MSIIFNTDRLRAIPTRELAKRFKDRPKGKQAHQWVIRNEIKPQDLYLYLFAKFGPPNGLMNLLRTDSSDNLIHWEWTFDALEGEVSIQGMNQRTDIWFIGDWDIGKMDKESFIASIKRDLPTFGKRISEIRKSLEDWETFLNPYYNLKKSTNSMRKKLSSLEVKFHAEGLTDYDTPSGAMRFAEAIENANHDCIEAFGLSTSLQALCPVVAECFVNLVILLLAKPEIRNNERLMESTTRANIDIKIQSLSLNCEGFSKQVDWNSAECRTYQTITNNRNDILHGNIKVNKLKTGEVFFNGKVPVFKNYSNSIKDAFDMDLKASGYIDIESNFSHVEKLIEYILSCLHSTTRESVEFAMESRELGRRKDNGRISVLFANHVADIFPERIAEK